MPFDAVFLTAVAQELRGAVGCRVDKVLQPDRDTIVLQLRGPGVQKRLLLTANPAHPRAHFTGAPIENPAQPPMFCMLLRKHLTGGRIAAITQPPMERLLDFTFDCTSEMGEPVQKRVVIEIMGRNSNLILLGPDGRILDCMRRVDFEMSDRRQVLPGLFYRLPPAQDKRSPLETDEAALRALLFAVDGQKRLADFLMETFSGLSPLVCRELACRICGDTDADLGAMDGAAREACASALAQWFSQLPAMPFRQVLLALDGRPKDFTYFLPEQYGNAMELREFPDFSSLLDAFYAQRDRAEQLRSRSQAIRKTVSNLRARTVRKLAAQRVELAATADRERKRQLGDILTANLYQIPRGAQAARCVDFYDPEMREITIPLDPALSPQQNAAKCYKDYAKAKTAERVLTQQIASGEQELDYLTSVLDALDRVESARDVAEIRQELVEGGYLREQTGKKRQKTPPSSPLHFVSSGGLPIRVGRNNRQNDQLTLREAAKGDLWLHAQKIPGSHVIVSTGGQPVNAQTLHEAAMLAAYYSQSRAGSNVPVDYTTVKNVKKPAGAKPGMVIYDHYNTAYVTPDPELAKRLKIDENR